MHYIYLITNGKNSKVYIGQTKKPTYRWSQHKNYASKNNPVQYIHRAMIKYGIDNFTYKVIATCKNQEDADYTEIELIVQYDSRNKEKGYNICPGGYVGSGEDHPMYGKNHTDEAKLRISQFQKKLNQSPEVIENKRQKMLGNTNCVGRKDSQETIAKRNYVEVAKKRIGQKRTPEQIKNIRLGTNKGKGTIALTIQQEQELCDLYNLGATTGWLMKRYNKNKGYIRTALIRHQQPLRRRRLK